MYASRKHDDRYQGFLIFDLWIGEFGERQWREFNGNQLSNGQNCGHVN